MMPFDKSVETKNKRDQKPKPSSLSSALPSSSQDIRQQDYKARISEYSRKMGGDEKIGGSSAADESTGNSEQDELVQLLAFQVYHLPGNNWLQDWWQFMTNNHPVFGICCHNKSHPIKSFTRIVALVGTVTFGLLITNLAYLFLLWNPDFDHVVASITTDSGTEFLLTTGMLLLWTVGGGIHCMFNLLLWHIGACACCQSGGFCESCACCPSLGKYMMRFFVFCTVAFSVVVIILRVAINDEAHKDSNANGESTDRGINILPDDHLDLRVEDVSEFSFVLNYLVEMTLAFFVYYPVGGTMLFSGILSCGYNIPLLGGRPYEIAREERRNMRQNESDIENK